MAKLLRLIVFCLVCVSLAKAKRKAYTAVALAEELMSQPADRLIRPFEGENATYVTLSVSFLDIIEVVEGTMEAYANFLGSVNMKWVDPRLKWSRSSYNLESLRVPLQNIWTPDVRLINNLEPKQEFDFTVKAIVHYNGTVEMRIPAELPVHCDHPRDPKASWECPLKFSSWTYNGLELNLQQTENMVDTSAFVDRVWMITSNNAKRNVIVEDCCPEPKIDITYTARLLRR